MAFINQANQEILENLSQVVTLIQPQYVSALLVLHERIGGSVKWVVNGSLAENLKIVQTNVEEIEIVTSAAGAKAIHEKMDNFYPEPLSFRTEQLPRNATVNGQIYPVFIRGYFFNFNLNGLQVMIKGDLQFKVGDWEWGDIFEFEPEYVYVVGKKIAVTPLLIAYQLYQCLGWSDRMEKISVRLEKQIGHREH